METVVVRVAVPMLGLIVIKMVTPTLVTTTAHDPPVTGRRRWTTMTLEDRPVWDLWTIHATPSTPCRRSGVVELPPFRKRCWRLVEDPDGPPCLQYLQTSKVRVRFRVKYRVEVVSDQNTRPIQRVEGIRNQRCSQLTPINTIMDRVL